MTDFVFLGPTLPVDDARTLLPDATFLPPVEHGDLIRLRPRQRDRVILIDGLFFRKPPVRHREITALLRQGTMVAGSSSMGALRAAELHRYGMRGVGRIFQLYRDGAVTGDDEVAVMHGPAEDGYRLLSEPLVNIRLALADAIADAVLDTDEAGEILAQVRALPFRARGYRALAALTGAVAEPAARFLRWRTEHPSDAKADGARLLLRMVAADDPALAPLCDGDDRPRHVDTHFYQYWLPDHRGTAVGDQFVSDSQTITAVRLLHPDFPAVFRQQALRTVAGGGTDPDEVRARAVAEARRRGLLTGLVTDPVARIASDTWLAPHESDLPATERVLRILVRAFGVMSHRTLQSDALAAELNDPDVLGRYRRFVATAMRLNGQLPRIATQPEYRMRFRAERIDAIFARLWDCPADRLEVAAWDRGIPSVPRFREIAEPLMSAVKIIGPPAPGPAPTARLAAAR